MLQPRPSSLPSFRTVHSAILFRGFASLLLLVVVTTLQAVTDPGVPDLSNRESARTWFNTYWSQTYGAPMGFTGDVVNGQAGDTSEAYRNQALLRYNIFRRMAGVKPWVLDAAKNHKAQLAAMVMAANGKASHTIDSSWKFYSEETRKAASECLLAYTYSDPMAAWAYLYDYGQLNDGVLGHRQFLIGGDVASSIGLGNTPTIDALKQSQALAVDLDVNRSPECSFPFSLWPSPGHVPNYLITGQWSIFVVDDGLLDSSTMVSFANAKVTVLKNGVKVPVFPAGARVNVGSTGGNSAIWTYDGTSDGSSSYDRYILSSGEIFSGSKNSDEDIVFHVIIEGLRYRVPDPIKVAKGFAGSDLGGGAPYNGTGRYEYDVIGYNPDKATSMVVKTQPLSQLVETNGTALLFTEASGVSTYQWFKDWTAIEGASKPWLQLTQFKATDAGSYHCLMTGPGGAIITGYAKVSLASGTPQKLMNISTRSQVGTGDEVQIAGFVISGTSPKSVLIRAGGVALAKYNLPGYLGDPQLSLYSGSTVLASNDDWSADTQKGAAISAVGAQLGATAWDAGTKDAALLVTLEPGPYTTIVSGKNGSTGMAMIEVYDAGNTGATRLLNISSRTLVKTGNDVQIAGFVINGDTPKTVLIRAAGPALRELNVSGYLSDPTLTVYNAKAESVGANDDWSSDTTERVRIEAAQASTGAFVWGRGSADAAILMTLQPGAYTVHVQGKNSATGVAMVEVYEVP